jgi:hypothetical protein
VRILKSKVQTHVDAITHEEQSAGRSSEESKTEIRLDSVPGCEFLAVLPVPIKANSCDDSEKH